MEVLEEIEEIPEPEPDYDDYDSYNEETNYFEDVSIGEHYWIPLYWDLNQNMHIQIGYVEKEVSDVFYDAVVFKDYNPSIDERFHEHIYEQDDLYLLEKTLESIEGEHVTTTLKHSNYQVRAGIKLSPWELPKIQKFRKVYNTPIAEIPYVIAKREIDPNYDPLNDPKLKLDLDLVRKGVNGH
jgi:hypothetical protein